MDVFVARQPIYDENRKVRAYELLYRENLENFFREDMSPSKTTAMLLTNSYLSIGIENLLDKETLGFINFDSKLILNKIPLLLDNKQVVIEILESVNPTKEIIDSLKELKSHNYTLAIDDFIYKSSHQEIAEIVDIIKVDFLKNSKEEIEIISKFWNNKCLLAEKVENEYMFRYAKNLGYSLFQGFYFSKPIILKGKHLQENYNIYLKILGELSQPEPSYDAISKAIESDVAITYKLLKLVNSKFSLLSKVHSIKHALAIMGIQEIRKWLSLIMVRDFSEDKNSKILQTALIRSKFSDQICDKSYVFKQKKQELTLLCLISKLDLLLNQDMKKILKSLPVEEQIKSALLLDSNSELFPIYELILNYENGKWEQCEKISRNNGINPDFLPIMYFESIKWTNELLEYIDF